MLAPALLTGCLAVAWEPDVSRFPPDPARLPARLELMRPGQVRDAVARQAACLLPVGVLEARGDAPLGGRVDAQEAALWSLAGELGAVLAPPILYGPTGCLRSDAGAGTFDAPVEGFAGYLEAVLKTLHAVGFRRVQVVPLSAAEPLRDAISFVLANLFNDFWKDPQFGLNWWVRPDRETLPADAFSLRELPALPDLPEERSPVPRLERLWPAELHEAMATRLSCFVPVGVIENHGNQCPLACDTFEALDPLLLAAAEAPCVVAPPVWYGPTGYAVTGPALATTDIDGFVYFRYFRGLVAGLAAMGFRDIVFLSVHQGAGGAQQSAERLAIQEYRATHPAGPKLEVLSPPAGQYDHAGRNETSWMLHLHGEHTDLSLVREGDYRFCWEPGNEAKLATADRGRELCGLVTDGLKRLIRDRAARD
ncbi:MAG: creatininase family protein [Armatimonadetes bacterium]|nr:creatininase family protein [Armatimonadota bacterium]